MGNQKDSEKKTTQERIAKNIKAIREAYGLSLSKLAIELDIPKTSLLYYENGERAIPDDRLLKIANYFLVSTDLIMNEDLSQKKKIELKLDGPKNTKVVFPIIKNDIALENHFFEWGYKKQCEFYEKLETASPTDKIDISELYKCIEEYHGSIKNVNCKEEAAANCIGLTYLLLIFVKVTPKLLLNETIIKKEFMKKYPSLNPEIITTDESEVALDEAYEEKIYTNLYEYKRMIARGGKYRGLLDYYLALQYKLGVVDNDLDMAWNEIFGIDLLQELAILGNKYAKKYLDILPNLE